MILTLVLHRSSWISKKSKFHTAMYKGRVAHTRFLPVKHAFCYPFFIFALDLDEIDNLFGNTPRALLWPLNRIVSFHEEDHLKNGEGSSSSLDEICLSQRMKQRVLNLVQQRTNGKFKSSSENVQILLLTHFRYYGYCFNPVSFYYVFKRNDSHDDESSASTLEAIVAEVSNTPWNEMYCYVLHPHSVDTNRVQPGRNRKLHERNNTNDDGDDASNIWKSVNYRFNKTFHVSPFMEMSHYYDWTFWIPTGEQIAISTTMLKKARGEESSTTEKEEKTKGEQQRQASFPDETTKIYFNAFVHVHRTSCHPLRICYEMIRFPFYCIIIQIWIHWEALFLFHKGVEFVPHPRGSETTASRIVGNVMTPFFAIKDWRKNSQKKKIE